MSVANRHFLDNLDVYATYGLLVSEGKAAFEAFPQRKDSLSHDWPEQHGTDIDLMQPRFADKKVALRCIFVGKSAADLLGKKANFLAALCSPGWHTWRVDDHDNHTYAVYYEDATGWSSPSRRLKVTAGDKSLLAFTLHLVAREDLNSINFDLNVTIRDSDGNVVEIVPPGGTYVLPAPPAEPEPDTLTITGVSVSQNTVTVTATTSGSKAIEYSLNGTSYQSSNTFLNVPNGTYSNVRARLVGTSIAATWPDPVVVNYTATLPVPAAPTNFVVDDTGKTASWTNSPDEPNLLGYEISQDGGGSWTQISQKPMPVTPPKIIGQVLIRVKATSTRQASASLSNPAPYTEVPTYNTALTPGQSAHGVTYSGLGGTVFHFNGPPPSGNPFPATMLLHLDGQPVGQVDFNQPYLGQPCAVEVNGTLYTVPGGFEHTMEKNLT
jgi:hypothetical protein